MAKPNHAAHPPYAPHPPLVILGLDAGDPQLIEEWAREGHLPTIASIMERGCWSLTEGPELISEHGVWVSLLSGLSRAQHGYCYFRQLEPGTYDLHFMTANRLGIEPFWARFRGSPRRVAAVDVPDTAPIAGLAGAQLADWASHHVWAPGEYVPASQPPTLLGEITDRFGPPLDSLEDSNATPERDVEIRAELIEHVRKKGDVCRHILSDGTFDLVVAVFAESHAANHQFWGYHPDRRGASVAAGEFASLEHATREVYQAIDKELAAILDTLPEEANVCVVSTVGMADKYPTQGLMDDFLRKLGYLTPSGSDGGKASLRPLDLLRRFVPEWARVAVSRALLGHHARERLVYDQFRTGTDWGRTEAFAIPVFYASQIRVNLKGREPAGVVEPGTGYGDLLSRLEADLAQLVDPESGEPAIARVSRTVDLFGLDGPPERLPDLFVEWRSGSYMPRVVHPRAELTQKRPEFFRRSDHSHHGFVAAAGPGIRRAGRIDLVDVLDLAPTFLHLMNEPPEEGMRGRVLREMLAG
jgi:predicted AlkP superfamily phosphohydrolase/phosphomutase